MRVCECGYDKPNQMARHLRTCKVRQVVQEREQLVQELREQLSQERELREQLVQEREELREELREEFGQQVAQLTQQVQSLQGGNVGSVAGNNVFNISNNSNSNNSNSNNSNSNNVTLIPFKQTPIPETTKELIRSLQLNHPEHVVSNYIMQKHFADSNTANVRLGNKRAKTMQVWDKDANDNCCWIEKNRKETIQKLAADNLEEIVDVHHADKQNAAFGAWVDRLPEEGLNKAPAWRATTDNVENTLITQTQAHKARARNGR